MHRSVITERLPVLPLRDTVIFPHVVMPLLVGRAGSLAALTIAEDTARATGDSGRLLMVAQRDSQMDAPGARDLYRVGTIVRVVQQTRLPNGTMRVLVEGMQRARVTRYTSAQSLIRAVVQPVPTVAPDEDEELLHAHARRAAKLFEEFVAQSRRLPAELVPLLVENGSLQERAFGIAAHLPARQADRQRLLEIDSLAELFDALARALQSELEIIGLERRIEQSVRGSVVRNQREFYLQEQLKAIHRELDGGDGDELDELDARLSERALPEAVEKRARRELRKLRRTSTQSPEHAVARNFLDWIVALPWNERADDVVDIQRARDVLDEDHHGLEEVKERILDHMAVLGLVGRSEGATLCLVGPPGVGKTSLGRSVARALGRPFVRMSLGGVRDEAEIRGHRRTYVGAMPGRIIRAMRRAGVVNPVILLDEVDKLGSDWRGDPSSALLEVLDPEQNQAFSDHYLEVDYDLSQVMFVTTANSLARIPEPLRDRMEIIRLPGYVEQEKLAIGKAHLLPRQLQRHGVDAERVSLGSGVLAAIVRGWTREAGVRDLERRLARIARKLARRVAEEGDLARLAVEVGDLPELLGPSPYSPDDALLEDRVGVAAGLAYTSAGGEVLEIEVSVLPGRGRLQLTGTLGEVMKESANAALSYARSRADQLGLGSEFHRNQDLHMHIPAGATPKDGPSAGIAICTAIVSALTGRAVRGDVAMTGELTLRGRVLAVGGLREKLVAAHRHGVRHVALPHGNARDLEKLPAEVREGVTFHLVKTMDEVLALALRDPEPGGDALGVESESAPTAVHTESVPVAARPN
jgi:ATP-dependent Lon protease